jgi:hypothetical protein
MTRREDQLTRHTKCKTCWLLTEDFILLFTVRKFSHLAKNLKRPKPLQFFCWQSGPVNRIFWVQTMVDEATLMLSKAKTIIRDYFTLLSCFKIAIEI